MNAATAETRPSLHEIAAMPFPASLEATRRWYDPQWGCEPELDENGDPIVGKRRFKVTVEYTVSRDETFSAEVEAADEAEADEITREMVTDHECGEVDISYVKVREMTQQ